MTLIRSEVLKLIGDINTRALTYHNHKEQSAWIAMVFFSGVSIALIGDKTGIWHEAGGAACWLYLLMYFGVFIATIMYLRSQLILRGAFGDITAACYALEAGIVSDPLIDIDPAAFFGNGSALGIRNRVFPKIVSAKAEEISKESHRERNLLESNLYCLMTIIFAFGLFSHAAFRKNLDHYVPGFVSVKHELNPVLSTMQNDESAKTKHEIK